MIYMDHHQSDFLFRHRLRIYDTADFSTAENQQSVRQFHQNVQIFSDKDHGNAFFLLLIQKIIDPVGGINIQSAHRICHDQHRRTARDLTSQQHFLDISAGKTSDRGLHTRRYDLQFLDQLFRQFSWLFAIHKNPFIVLITSKHDIIRHIHTGNQSHTKAVFRHIRHRDPLF